MRRIAEQISRANITDKTTNNKAAAFGPMEDMQVERLALQSRVAPSLTIERCTLCTANALLVDGHPASETFQDRNIRRIYRAVATRTNVEEDVSSLRSRFRNQLYEVRDRLIGQVELVPTVGLVGSRDRLPVAGRRSQLGRPIGGVLIVAKVDRSAARRASVDHDLRPGSPNSLYDGGLVKKRKLVGSIKPKNIWAIARD